MNKPFETFVLSAVMLYHMLNDSNVFF